MAKSIALAILHQGLVRKHNEDNLYILDSVVPLSRNSNYEHSAASSDPLQLYAVADGRGGSGIGDEAALAVLRMIDRQKNSLRPGGRLDFTSFARETVDLANRAVCDLLAPYNGLPVGATLSLLAIDRDMAYTVSLGNSRVYLFRDSQLFRLTEDHVGQLPDRRRLTRYIGSMTESETMESENMTRTSLNRGDILLLMTDGISDCVSDEQIASCLSDPAAFIQQIRHIRELALAKGGCDNLALIGVRIQESQTEDSSVITGNRTNKERRQNAAPTICGSGGYLPDSLQRRIWQPILFFIFFILLGILLGKIIFSMPAWLKLLFSS